MWHVGPVFGAWFRMLCSGLWYCAGCLIRIECSAFVWNSGVPRVGWGFNHPLPRNSEGKVLQNVFNSTRLWKLLKIAEFRTPTPQDVRKKGSKFLKLPPVRNCFTLAMTNKLIVIINSLKIPKIKKILLYKWNFLYQITAASRTPDKGAAAPRYPRSLCLQRNLLSLLPRAKFLDMKSVFMQRLWNVSSSWRDVKARDIFLPFYRDSNWSGKMLYLFHFEQSF